MTRERQALGALALTTLLWATTFVVVRGLVSAEKEGSIPPLTLVAIRFGIAAAGALTAMLAFRKRIAASTWRRGTVLGILTAGGFGFQTLGLQFTTSARSAFITNVSLLLVPVFGVFLRRPWPGRGWWFGAAIALGGLWILEFPWDAESGAGHGDRLSSYFRGDVLTIGCAVFFALQILATELLSPKEPLLPLVFVQFASCAACALGAAAILGELRQPLDVRALPGRAMAEILYLAILATGACLLVQAWAQRHTSSVRAAIIFMLEPVLACILGLVVLGEHLTPAQWAGAGAVVGGILLAENLAAARSPA